MASIEQQLRQLEKRINKDIHDVLYNDVAEVVKDEMTEAIQTSVYDRYSPSQYQRQMDNGGLTDRNNMQSTMIGDNTLVVKNIRRDGDRDVVGVIIDGTGYTWENSRIYSMQPFPRNFYEETIERLLRSKNHVSAMKKGLRNKGYNVV